MDIFQEFCSFLAKKIAENHDIFHTDDNFIPQVEFPKSAEHGDFTSNVAMVLAKKAKQNPRKLAEILQSYLQEHSAVEQVDVAGAGFLNWRVKPDYFHQTMLMILQEKEKFGHQPANGQKINVEYVSANPTGPLHVGHVRGAVFGDVVANILSACGYDVLREYYINDAGNQVALLTRSVYWRYQELLSANDGEMPADYYPGDYLIPIAEKIMDKDGKKWLEASEEEYFAYFRDETLAIIMEDIREDLSALNITMDCYNSEQKLVTANKTDEAVAHMAKKNLVYQGVLPPPKGKLPDDWEEREQLLFKSTDFGDEIDRPLQKSDGNYTYFSNDIACHYDKYQRGFTRMINIFGADHGGYVKRLKAAVQAMSDGKAVLEIALMQIVRLMDAGQPMKMSKRSGSFVTLRQLVDAVGADAIRFTMLTRDNNAQMDFDFSVVTAQSSDNPVFYVQYAHARICSVKNLVRDAFPDENFDNLDSNNLQGQEILPLLDLLRDEKELAIIKKCAYFPIILEQAGSKVQPHLLSYYLLELAELFHKLWSAGNRDLEMRFIVENNIKLTKARLILAEILLNVLRNGLQIMQVEAPEKL